MASPSPSSPDNLFILNELLVSIDIFEWFTIISIAKGTTGPKAQQRTKSLTVLKELFLNKGGGGGFLSYL